MLVLKRKMNLTNLKFAKPKQNYKLLTAARFNIECREPSSQYRRNINSIPFEIPDELLKKAHENDVQALFQISYLACADDRLGLAREFLRLAFEASRLKHSIKSESNL